MSEHHKEREAAYFRAPFSVSPNVSADNRIPNALEYIAANIGIIARILERAEADGRLGAASIGELARTAPQTQAEEIGRAVTAEIMRQLHPKSE